MLMSAFTYILGVIWDHALDSQAFVSFLDCDIYLLCLLIALISALAGFIAWRAAEVKSRLLTHQVRYSIHFGAN